MSARAPYPNARGFTLIEILVVLVLSLGMVMTVTQIYRATGRTMISLKGGLKEWQLQDELRAQVRALILPKVASELQVKGSRSELYLPSWKSRQVGHNGKPVLARYTIDTSTRRISYQEIPLIPWWGSVTLGRNSTRYLADQMLRDQDITLLTGTEDAQFHYLGNAEDFNNPGAWQDNWEKPVPPQLIKLSFGRGGRNYEIWLELHDQTR
jgi:prepilin-type N-terminal cleavage/methylation domain-containing protein